MGIVTIVFFSSAKWQSIFLDSDILDLRKNGFLKLFLVQFEGDEEGVTNTLLSTNVNLL